jgi:hypothetical protein
LAACRFLQLRRDGKPKRKRLADVHFSC